MTERQPTNRATADRRPRRTLRTTAPCSHRSATGSNIPLIFPIRPECI